MSETASMLRLTIFDAGLRAATAAFVFDMEI